MDFDSLVRAHRDTFLSMDVGRDFATVDVPVGSKAATKGKTTFKRFILARDVAWGTSMGLVFLYLVLDFDFSLRGILTYWAISFGLIWVMWELHKEAFDRLPKLEAPRSLVGARRSLKTARRRLEALGANTTTLAKVDAAQDEAHACFVMWADNSYTGASQARAIDLAAQVEALISVATEAFNGASLALDGALSLRDDAAMIARGEGVASAAVPAPAV